MLHDRPGPLPHLRRAQIHVPRGVPVRSGAGERERGEGAVSPQEAVGGADCDLGIPRSESAVLAVETTLGLVST